MTLFVCVIIILNTEKSTTYKFTKYIPTYHMTLFLCVVILVFGEAFGNFDEGWTQSFKCVDILVQVGHREADGSHELRVADFGLSRITDEYSVRSASVCPVRYALLIYSKVNSLYYTHLLHGGLSAKLCLLIQLPPHGACAVCL